MISPLKLLSEELVRRVLDETFQLLVNPGVKVHSLEARQLLEAAGAQVDGISEVAQIPESLIRNALETAPAQFYLYNHHGEATVTYGGDAVHFDPGSSGVSILDPETMKSRPSVTKDLVTLVKVAELLPQYDAQSTAVVCNEVPKDIGDIYRLYIVLRLSVKPVVTGAFSIRNVQPMLDMLAIYAGGREALKRKPTAIFDVCPTPPLIWSEFAAQNLIELARAGVPAQIVSMPLAGVAAPVTLLGSVVQHAAECLSGIVIHQLAQPGSPVVWGGAPAIFDMRNGTTPMGAIETAMIDVAYAQIGKALKLPTHTYLGASDAKVVDAQAGLESGLTALIGAQAGINMISGAGMLDFLACQSPEKLVVDAEAIGMAKRMLEGIKEQTPTLATELFTGINFKADFLKQKTTRQLFRQEQYLPSSVIDRASNRTWQADGQKDTFARARERVVKLLQAYQLPVKSPEVTGELERMMTSMAQKSGMEGLPDLPHQEYG